MFGTPDDPVTTIQHELRDARRHVRDLEDAPREGRTVSVVAWWDSLCAARLRVQVLERELAEEIAAEIARAEGHR